jgi:hypothetical protein
MPARAFHQRCWNGIVAIVHDEAAFCSHLAVVASSMAANHSNELAASEALVRWGQLVNSCLWAEELSFGHLLEMAKTQIAHRRQQASFLHNVSLSFPFPRCRAFPIE